MAEDKQDQQSGERRTQLADLSKPQSEAQELSEVEQKQVQGGVVVNDEEQYVRPRPGSED